MNYTEYKGNGEIPIPKKILEVVVRGGEIYIDQAEAFCWRQTGELTDIVLFRKAAGWAIIKYAYRWGIRKVGL